MSDDMMGVSEPEYSRIDVIVCVITLAFAVICFAIFVGAATYAGYRIATRLF